MPARDIEILLSMIDQAYDRPSWHGPNLKASVRRVTAEEAAWRPGPRRHNIHELAVHAAYWKYAARRRLTQEKRGSFPFSGSNWFRRPSSPDPALWKSDLALLDAMHRSFREVLAALDPADLDRITPGAKTTNLAMITGMAAHDLYHAGQIQLLKRLQRG